MIRHGFWENSLSQSALQRNAVIGNYEVIQMLDRVVRDAETVKVTGLSPTTIWRLEKAGKFPKKRKLPVNAVGRLESEIAEWLQDPEGWAEKHNKEVTIE